MVKESASEKGQDPARSLVKKVKILVTQLCLTLYNPVKTVAHQAPLSLEFSRQEYWSGLPFSSSENFPDPGIEPMAPPLQADSLLLSHQQKLMPS